MTFIHGRTTQVLINAVNLSAFINSTDFNDGVDVHDVTCYGAARKAYFAGLGDGKVTLKGTTDNGAAGPRRILKPLMAAGTAVTLLFRPEGTGVGKIQDQVSVIVTAFNESAPVADMAQWTAELQMTGTLSSADQ